jgi:hypothetical protein
LTLEVSFLGSACSVVRIPFPLPVATIRNEKLEVSDWTAGPEGRSFGEMSSEEDESDEE